MNKLISKKLKSKQTEGQKGFVILISVILLAVIGATIVTSLVMLGLNSSLENFNFLQSQSANFLANSCGEKALGSLKDDSGYLGNETLTLFSGSCQIMAIVQTGSVYNIQIQSTFGDTTKKNIVVATKTEATKDSPAAMNIVLWQEVGDF